ncbi:NAD-binding protein, partial [archaeon]|nr:NAD-binding protein [archaeon]
MNVVILGSSLFAKELAKELSNSEHKVFIVVKDKDVALEISSENEGIIVVNSDPSKQAVLDELELENCDVLIAATEKEE